METEPRISDRSNAGSTQSSASRSAATSFAPGGKDLFAEKSDDENAWCLNGVAGHAGLFGTAGGVFSLVSFLWNIYDGKISNPLWTRDLVRLFWTRSELAEALSDWCLGYDTPSRKVQSAGRYFSAESVGHLGFTGVSFWLDLEKRILVILLTNRVHPTRENDEIRQFRPVLHDIIMEALNYMENDGFKKIYMVGIGGIAMGTLATMLKQSGFEVAGSDQNLYPPMSTHLRTLGIPLFEGFSQENPQKFAPDLFIIGNVSTAGKPGGTIRHWLRPKPCLSMPQAISRLFLNGKKSVVVAGTHGKSTTSSLLAWVLEQGGKDPRAFIGAFVRDWGRSYRLGSGEYMVLEGDEYDTAFFDKGPKFLHYQPHIGIITSIEFDHADIFPDLDAVLKAFRGFVRLIPEQGYLIINADDPNCVALASECKGRLITYGRSHRADWRIKSVDFHSGEVLFQLRNPGTSEEETFRSKLAGKSQCLERHGRDCCSDPCRNAHGPHPGGGPELSEESSGARRSWASSGGCW